MNKELKEQAHNEFDEQFKYFSAHEMLQTNQGHDIIKSFIDSLIDRTVQMTEERIAKEIMQISLDSLHEARTLRLHIDGTVFPDVDLDLMGKILLKKLSLITNKSDNNTK